MVHSFSRLALTALSLSLSNALCKNADSLSISSDNVGARTLTTNAATAGGVGALTVEICESTCQSLGYVLAGVEYSGECYCGNNFSNGGGPASDGEAGCNMKCNGNSSETCGGPGRLSVYDFKNATANLPTVTTSSVSAPTNTGAPTGWKSLGCYNDTVGTRTLTTQIYSIAGNSMSVKACLSACISGGYRFSGVEYGSECYCDHQISNYGAPAGGCTMACAGNSTEFCGGSAAINVYNYTATTLPSTPTPTISSGVVPSATITDLPKGWTYKGCWVDRALGRGSILANNLPNDVNMTVESCIHNCISAGYNIAGMEYYTQCYCDSAIINLGALASSDSQCNTACGGNPTQMCGGGDRMNECHRAIAACGTEYEFTGKLEIYGMPNICAQMIETHVTWNEKLISSDKLSELMFGNPTLNSTDIAIVCGDVQDVINQGATIVSDSQCTNLCSGNRTQYCGGPDLISYYVWTGQPLDSWTFKTGNSAGSYQFLIGGPIIPLVSTVGINNKISFLEKFGTEPANNSTGAYELDLTLIDNYTAAWRPMHVKTDVFCSAGLVLPDRLGRQINIGGWALPSTIGLRFYTPDGAPGKWSTNDWEENYNEVGLQTGRWYPSAMTMANGSILVVGGEVGSNGAAVPSLEIIPRPPGGNVLYCDYLARTDPYNLYPYLIVLPTGGIFIAYYNEARILDEVTLATKKVLPNIPAAVNNFLGGRTYPMEGTAVVMPQSAPYTDPLTFMVCGGSTPGPEIALDNCVSLQPEVAGANWTIERMPSKRVISSMVALPDGTFLILNGAQQGFAGFGLATSPNHNAVLYDPTKPLHNRMSVLANTTIDRLYHNEAVLLPDGRVLVTGSDPEDLRFTQEYRVEVFIPPYLMGGVKQPNVTLTNGDDFAYSDTITISVILYHGTPSSMRVSLMTAVSATHGNSFGQRTYFPSFSCTGSSTAADGGTKTTCTVQTPPNAHVYQPGWAMLYVLDNGTPSWGQWLRIGGDPAKIGLWPNFPDFTLPGMGPTPGAGGVKIQGNLTRRGA
ncbi:WSC domain-containing protein [Rutstroemia sp. NJR-2017a BBW]|nr:WSC domain-containing protein [Rutstroemia sp. NJR-2017a BBW]